MSNVYQLSYIYIYMVVVICLEELNLSRIFMSIPSPPTLLLELQVGPVGLGHRAVVVAEQREGQLQARRLPRQLYVWCLDASETHP